VSGFKVAAPHQSVHDLTDGVALAHILHQMDGGYFDNLWLSSIKNDVADNYRLKSNNLRKVLNHILHYFKEVSGNVIVDYEMPDVGLIGKTDDTTHLGRLLQLMLGVAVNCPGKQRYIEEIMVLDEDVQHVVMTAIQGLMNHYQPISTGDGDNDILNEESKEYLIKIKELEAKLNDTMSEKDEMAQRCHELDMQVAMLHEEKSSIQIENNQLQEKLQQSENFEDPTSPISIRHTQMLVQIESLQEETYRLEASRDDYKLRLEVVDNELSESQRKIEQLSALAEETRLLKDEIDYLQSASTKVSKLEAVIETYKTKLKDFNDIRGQVKLLEDKNTSYMERTIELEDELKKANLARTQLDSSKRQVYDLQSKLSEETRRGDKAEFELKTQLEKMRTLQSEKQVLLAERDSLRDTNDELQVAAQEAKNEHIVNEDGDHQSPLEVKEKLIRLQHENKMLKLQQADDHEEKVQSLLTDLDLANKRINELETETRLDKQKIMELQVNVGDLQSDLANKQSFVEENAALRQKLNEHMVQLHETHQELQSKKAYIEKVEPHVAEGNKQLDEMKDLLMKKEDEMKAMEDRYKKYLEKAKSVIRSLDPNKNQMNNAPHINNLQADLVEKEKYIKQLERDQERSKSVRDQEEKLIVNAWYNMGMQLHRKAVDQRLTSTNPGQSFLARQRQVSSARRSLPNAVQRDNDFQHKRNETLASWTYM
jgi:protein HOOK3